jgi:hypothetical protein
VQLEWEDFIKRRNLPKPNIELPFKRDDVDDDGEENEENDVKPIDSKKESCYDNTPNDLEIDRWIKYRRVRHKKVVVNLRHSRRWLVIRTSVSARTDR